jgi:hypothetical protein
MTTTSLITLHIEHPITDFGTWSAAYDRFAGGRQQAGVRSERVARPVDDDHYVVIDLDFAARDQAERFLGFLQSTVWASRDASPALAGKPLTRILEMTKTAEPAATG